MMMVWGYLKTSHSVDSTFKTGLGLGILRPFTHPSVLFFLGHSMSCSAETPESQEAPQPPVKRALISLYPASSSKLSTYPTTASNGVPCAGGFGSCLGSKVSAA